MVPGRKRPAKHLVAMSAELAKTKRGADREGARTILCDDDPVFVLYRVASRYGLPVAPEWAPWFMRELNQRKLIAPLLGLGCSPVLVKANKQTLLKWIGRALRGRLIRIPAEKGSISWKLRSSRELFACQSELTAQVNYPRFTARRCWRKVNSRGHPSRLLDVCHSHVRVTHTIYFARGVDALIHLSRRSICHGTCEDRKNYSRCWTATSGTKACCNRIGPDAAER